MRQTNYDDIAATYNRRYRDEDYAGIERALSDFVGGVSRRVLEVGCGTGHWLDRLHRQHCEPMGLDPSWQMLSRVRPNPLGRLVQARAEDIPFRNESFDRLFCINAHHHFIDKRKFLEEAHRVIRPGGSLMTVALDPHNGTDQWWIYDYFEGTLEIDKDRYPSCQQLHTWMTDVGFSNVHTRQVQHLPGDVKAIEAVRKGLVTRDQTSQLAVLTIQEFEAGLQRIYAAIREDDQVRLSSDLRVYATFGTVS